MRVLKNLVQTRGGPDFGDCRQVSVDCGCADIEFFVPRSHIGADAPWTWPTTVDLSNPSTLIYQEPDVKDDQRTHHQHIVLGIGSWGYWPPTLAFLLREPYVWATATWQIERTKQNIQMASGDLGRLIQYLKDDYAVFFEQEGDGKLTCGPAWQVKKRLYDFYSGRHHPIEFYASEIKEILVEKLPKLPDDYTEVNFSNTRWVRYSYVPHRGLPTAINYSLPLDANHLLTVSISLGRFLEGDEKWLAQARADFDRLVAGTQVHFRHVALTARGHQRAPNHTTREGDRC